MPTRSSARPDDQEFAVTPSYGWYGDDFTGATDTLATLACRGQRAFLFLKLPEERHLAEVGELDAVGIAGAARTMTRAEIRSELAPVGEFFRRLGVRVIHYKCCSTFDSAPERGNIATAISILRDYVDHPGVAIVGGQPSLGRYCAFSNLFAASGLEGDVFRLDRHPTMSRHPATPMTEADLGRHLAELGLPDVAPIHWPLLAKSDDLVREEWERLSQSSQAILFDALEQRHVEAVGRLCQSQSKQRSLLMVGASSVAQACFEEAGDSLSGQPAAPGPVLAFVGSLSPTTRGQVAAARSYHRIPVDPDDLTTSAHLREQVVDKAVAALAQGLNVMLSTAPETGEAPPAATDSLADLSGLVVDSILKRHPVRRLAIAGGDTSSKIVGRLGFWGLGYQGQISNGVAVSVARSSDKARDNMHVLLKGGQMGHTQLFETFLAH
jgi:3-oxoisoapionate kinase